MTVPPVRARPREGAPGASEPVFGACVHCAETGLLCALHAAADDPQPARRASRPPTRADDSAAPPGVPSRTGPLTGGPGRGRAGRRARRALARAVGRARGRAYGRERARRRVDSGRWDPHPGWRNRVDTDLVILSDQAAALHRIEHLTGDELWRADKRTRWTRMLRRLAYAMDWTTGLVCGVTLAQLAEAGDCSPRTVSRLLGWAQDAELIVVVETGAAATFLGSRTNRAPAYVLVAPSTPPSHQPVDCDEHPAAAVVPVTPSAQLTGSVDESGDLPQSYVSSKPLAENRRLNKPSSAKTDWSLWQIPSTPAERSAATETFLGRTGLKGQVPTWRAGGLLYQWWNEGVCIAGLLHMVDHYPGQPDQSRGNGLRGATDPLRVLGHRLRPWISRLDALPAHLTGRHGNYLNTQAAQVAHRVDARRQQAAGRPRPASEPTAARKAARATIAKLLAGRAGGRTVGWS